MRGSAACGRSPRRAGCGRENHTRVAPATGLAATGLHFFVQVLNHQAEPLIDGKFFQDALAAQRIAHEGGGHEIGEHFRIAQIGKIAGNFSGEVTSVAFEFVVKLEHFRPERFCFHRGLNFRFERVDRRDREWRFLFEGGKTDALQTLQNQIGSTIPASDAGANESGGGKMKKIFRCVPFRATRLDQRHAKHPVMMERVLEHLAITRLENVKWEQRVRKEHCTGERHDRHLMRKLH